MPINLRRGTRWTWPLTLTGACLVVIAGCGRSGFDELGAPCSASGGCPDPLVCTAGRCEPSPDDVPPPDVSPFTNRIVVSAMGTDTTWTVPTATTLITVRLWGAGGGGAMRTMGSPGGGGAFAHCTLVVAPGEVLTIIVGSGGLPGTANTPTPAAYGGGGKAGQMYGGGGGGRTAVIGAAGELCTAGAGGGGATEPGGDGGTGGLVGTSGVSNSDMDGSYGEGGGGGATATGGAGGRERPGTSIGSEGASLRGGDACQCWGTGNAGGGGGGYFGGGAGGGDGNGAKGGGGGGGSSYAPNGTVIDSIGRQAAAQTDPNYVTGIGMGGIATMPGGNGLAIIAVD